MFRLYRNIFLFFLPVLLALILLPVEKRQRYAGLENDCFNHGIWVYDRIFQNADPIDIAFIGSSHTVNGVNDSLLEQLLGSPKLRIANLGYCRLGRNFGYLMAKEVMGKKQVRVMVLEVREDEDRFSHPIFPYLAENRDVLTASPWLNHRLFKDYFTHFSYQLELWKDHVFRQENTPPLQSSDYGFASSADTAAAGVLEQAQARSRPLQAQENLARNLHMAFPRSYLKKIHELCEQQEVKLVFLYLPAFGNGKQRPLEWNTYLSYGPVWMPPDSILDRKANWHDDNHLNQSGAHELAEWLALELNTLDLF